ncbi:hypothetical protein [Cytobacillus firmus]|uniref:hypothetical protein n=1 Tax=Cytobacillus firmus TaxID=1399 RepID=UPI0018CE1F9D|nr:hypothetical protein [Cytobacillus firmus]MBG9548529.1 hypothetical protein [Cytobacillus firmus]MBG9602951.1 hypothetical protein [Cytobacillus firmus]MBG9654863.1 hypothetical protein [Cytobacillus firmus]MED1906130.1 hypothetical protein [Cytobacillus firmus]MED1941545.1 hypothetical protein [Cytobacillus firmus]
MDYKAFFAEVADWIMQANTMAINHGMDSEAFWKWVMDSTAAICEKHKNNKLVLDQMIMLFHWLEDFYAESVRGKRT